jgi:hypothetical protein
VEKLERLHIRLDALQERFGEDRVQWGRKVTLQNGEKNARRVTDFR